MIARVYGSLEAQASRKESHFCRGEHRDDFFGLAKKVVQETGSFDPNNAETQVTTIPSPIIISGTFNLGASLQELKTFQDALNYNSKMIYNSNST